MKNLFQPRRLDDRIANYEKIQQERRKIFSARLDELNLDYIEIEISTGAGFKKDTTKTKRIEKKELIEIVVNSLEGTSEDSFLSIFTKENIKDYVMITTLINDNL